MTHRMFGSDVESRTKCGKCKKETVRSSKSLVFELAYPDLGKYGYITLPFWCTEGRGVKSNLSL